MDAQGNNAGRLIGILLFVAALGVHGISEPEQEPEIFYLVTVPKTLVAGSTERVLVKLHDPYKPVAVWVTLALEDDVIAEDASVVGADEETFHLKVPNLESCLNRQKQRAQLTVYLKYQGAAAWVVNKEREVEISCVNSETFVQTDKAIYKPGQTVYFRILTLDQNFIPITKPIESIWIEAPNKVRVIQWNDQTRESNGLIDLSFPMTSDPLLGSWTIHVLFEGKPTKQKFDVEEYDVKPDYIKCACSELHFFPEAIRGNQAEEDGTTILPRFEVKLYSPTYVLVTDEVISVEVCAVYTYGKPVRGSILLQAKVKKAPVFRYIVPVTGSPEDTISASDNDGEISFRIEDTDNDGCGTIDVDLTALNIIFRQLVNTNDEIILNATFTELTSGISHGANVSVDITSRQMEMEWLSEDIYRPGLPYYGKIRVTTPDGSPASEIFSDMSCSQGDEVIFSQYLASGNDGLILFSTDTIPAVLTPIVCKPLFPQFPSLDDYDPTYNTLEPFHRSFRVEALYSASNSYMQFDPVEEIFPVGETASLTLRYTWNSYGSVEPRIQYQAIAKGNYLDVNFLEDVHYHEQLVKLKVDIAIEMTPEVRVIAYYIREDTEVVTASVAIRVLPALLNKVKIGFSSVEVEPGDYTTLDVEADPGSLCAVGVVDESVVLLGGDNQLTPEKVFASVEKYQLTSSDGSRSCIPVSEETEEQDEAFISFGGGISSPKYKDGSEAFLDSGVIYISNLRIETSPCSPPVFFRAYAFAPAVAVQEDSNTVEEASLGEENLPTRVRSYFPETWLWDLYPIGSSGTASVIVNAPDTITDWVGSGFCLNRKSGIGISDQIMIRAFRPFFIELHLPYSVIRGEEIPVQMTIFNYLPRCIVVRVEIKRSTQFDLLDAESQVECVCNAVGMEFYIKPLRLGFIPIEVTAVSEEDLAGICGDSDMSGNVGTKDAIRRDLLVEAEGVEQEQTHNAFFCPQDYVPSPFLDQAAVLLPDNYVPDSAKGKITLTGDVLGPTLTNLEKLLRIPTGCGEQNMLGLVPNIYVLLYFTSTSQAIPEITSKAEENILIGYQKQLNYRLRDGSYSAFGDSDKEGSAWLTAFVVRSFAQARDFVTIDNNDLSVSVQWLKSLQNRFSGCFRNSGRVIHKGMQGGVNDEVTLTAYILLAICETGVSLQDEAIVNGLRCLENRSEEITDNYAISLTTYALVKLRSFHVREVFERLKERSTSEGGLVHWESNRPDIPSNRYYYRHSTPSINVEITAYALLSYLAFHELSDAISESSPVVRWLVQQQNPRGGFSSTQDTVVALQALAEYSALIFGDLTNIKVTAVVSPPCEIKELNITHENRLVLQEQEIDVFPTFVQFAATGNGCALLKVSWKYNIFPEVRNDAPFILNYTVTPFENEVSKYSIEICARYTGDDETSNMALVENKPQSGFAPIQDSVNNIVKENVKRVDVEGRTVVVYFQELNKIGDCVSYDVEKILDVRQAKDGVLTVFDYYEKELATNLLYRLQDEKFYNERCPLCSEDVPDNFKDIFCNSSFVYKTLVGQNGNLHLYGDERNGTERPKKEMPFYVSLEFPKGCVCKNSRGKPLVKKETPLLVMANINDLKRDEENPRRGSLSLDNNSAVIRWSFSSRLSSENARKNCSLT